MAEIDKLEIGIKTSADDATQGLTKLVSALESLNKILDSTDTNAAEKMNQAIANLGVSAGSAANSTKTNLSKLDSATSKTAKSVSKSVEEIKKKYADIGKGYTPKATTLEGLNREAESFEHQLQNAKIKLDMLKADNVSDSKMFKHAIANIAVLENKLSAVRNKINAMGTDTSDIDALFARKPVGQKTTTSNNTEIKEAVNEITQVNTVSKQASESMQQLGTTVSTVMTSAQEETESEITFMQSLKNVMDMATRGGARIAAGFIGLALRLTGESNNVNSALDNLINTSEEGVRSLTELKEIVSLSNKENAGKSYTDGFKDLMKQISATERKLNNAQAGLERYKETARKVTPTGMKRFSYDIEQARNQLEEYNAEMQRMIVEGEAFKNTTESTNGSGYGNMIPKSFSKVVNLTNNGLKSLIGTTAKAVFPVQKLRKAMSNFSITNLGLYKSLARLAKMLRLMVVRMALRGVIDGVKTGFQNLVKYSDEVNASASMLMNSLNTLKNSFAAMTAPILNAFAPALNTLINYLTAAVNKVNQLISALLGRSTWIRATALTDDYASSLGSAGSAAKGLNKQLQKFDELNNLNGDNGGGGGGGSGSATSAEDMFETVDVDSYWKELAQKIKESWETADFTWLGTMFGEKVKAGLESINWDKIKTVSQKIGKTVGTLITGFVEVPNLGDEVGLGIANALDTVVLGLNSFFTSVHWDSVGKFIANGINSIIKSDLFPDTARLLANALNAKFQTIGAFASTFDWSALGNTVATTINTFFSTFDLQQAGVSLGNIAKGLVTAFSTALDGTDWVQVGNKLGELIAGLDIPNLAGKLVVLAGKIIVALSEALVGSLSKAPLETSLIALFAGMKLVSAVTGWAGLGSTIISKLGEVITKAATTQASSLTIAGEAIGGSVLNVIVLGLGTAFAGFSFGEWLYNNTDLGTTADWIVDKLTPDVKTPDTSKTTGEDIFNQQNRSLGLYDKYNQLDVDTYKQKLIEVYDASVAAGDSYSTAYAKAMLATNDYLTQITGKNQYTADMLAGWQATVDKNTSTTTEKIKSSTKEITSDVTKQALSFRTVGTSMSSLSDSAKTNLSKIDGYVKQYINFKTGESNMSSLSDGAKKAFTTIDQYCKENGITIEQLASDYGVQLPKMTNTTESETRKMGTATTGLSGQFSSARSNILGSTTKISSDITTMSATGQAQVNNLGNTTISKMSTASSSAQGSAKSMNSGVVSSLKGMTESGISWLSNLSGNMVSKLAEGSANGSAQASGMKSSVLQSFIDMARDAASNSGPLSSFVSTVGYYMGNATAKVDAETPAWNSAGSDLVAGLKNGTNMAWNVGGGSLLSKVVEWASNLTSKIKSVFKIGSPSKVWRDEIGKWLPAGLAVGIDENADMALQSATVLGENVTATLQDSINNPFDDLDSKLQGTQAKVSSTVNGSVSGSITGDIAEALEETQTEQNKLLREQNSLLEQILEKDTSISATEVFKAVKKTNRQIYNQTGRNALVY